MIARIVEHNASALDAAADKLPDTPGRALMAYVKNSLRAPDADDRVSGVVAGGRSPTIPS